MGKKLAINVTVGGDTYKAGSTPPAEVAKLIDHPRAYADGAESAESDNDADVVDYNDTAQFKAEDLEKLAADRGLEVKGTGANDKVLKKDLVAALEADDASKS